MCAGEQLNTESLVNCNVCFAVIMILPTIKREPVVVSNVPVWRGWRPKRLAPGGGAVTGSGFPEMNWSEFTTGGNVYHGLAVHMPLHGWHRR